MARVFYIFGWCLCCAALVVAVPAKKEATPADEDAKVLSKRSAAPESNHDDYPDYLLGVKYDEYPMIVPKKRAAMLIDRLMVALQKAIEDEEGRGLGPRTKNYALRSDDGMDLQRRGHQSVSGQKNGRYWRCYFNAVTCF